MITFDFLITVLVIIGIVKLYRAILAPKSGGTSAAPRVQKAPERAELHRPPAPTTIVDATFEEIE